MTVGGMGFIPERLLMIMMMISCAGLRILQGRHLYIHSTPLINFNLICFFPLLVTQYGITLFCSPHVQEALFAVMYEDQLFIFVPASSVCSTKHDV